MSPGHISLGQAKYHRAITSTPPSKVWPTTGYHALKKKEKKMGWIKRKFAQWSREAWESAREEEVVYATDVVRAHEGVTGKSSIRFTIYAASGGHVIEYYKQDRHRDGDGPELVIVKQGDELGKAVEHILTMEALKS
jgi:hypothetical protein